MRVLLVQGIINDRNPACVHSQKSPLMASSAMTAVHCWAVLKKEDQKETP